MWVTTDMRLAGKRAIETVRSGGQMPDLSSASLPKPAACAANSTTVLGSSEQPSLQPSNTPSASQWDPEAFKRKFDPYFRMSGIVKFGIAAAATAGIFATAVGTMAGLGYLSSLCPQSWVPVTSLITAVGSVAAGAAAFEKAGKLLGPIFNKVDRVLKLRYGLDPGSL